MTREVDGGLETVAPHLPRSIITTDLRLNEPRAASLPNIMKARKKPHRQQEGRPIWGVDPTPRLTVVRVDEPGTESRPEGRLGVRTGEQIENRSEGDLIMAVLVLVEFGRVRHQAAVPLGGRGRAGIG